MSLSRILRPSLVCCALLLAPLVFAQEADIAVTKDGPAVAPADTDVSYSISVINGGPDNADVTLTDNIPAGMTFVSETHDPAFNCTDPGVGNPGTVTCTAATLTAGATANFTFVFHIAPATPPGTVFTNTATATSSVFDPNDENNSGIAVTSTPPPPTADVGVTKVGPNFAAANSDVTYTITFSNGGPDAATDAGWDDTLPGTMTFVSLTQDSGPTMSCTTGGTITCSASSFPNGAIASFTLVGHIPPATAGGTSFTNVASTSSETADPNPENDASQTTLIVQTVDLSVVKSGPANVNAGTDFSYTITIANAGPDTATGVTLTDVLPAGVTFVSLTQDAGPTGNCGTPIPGQNGTVTCSWANLGNGASAQFTLTVNSGSATSISNTATAGTEGADTNGTNNDSTVNTTVTTSADLSVAKNAPATVTAGTDMTYSITFTNAGPSNAVNAQVADTLPAGTSFVSATQTSGTPAFNCTGTTTITCSAASFPAGTVTFDFVVHVASSVASGTTLSNTATGSSSTTDPNGGNDSGNASTTVNTSADLSIVKNGPAAVAPGTDITYTINVANAGPSDAANVQISDVMPPNTTFVSNTQNSGPTFNCTNPAPGANGTITCTLASFAAGASASFTFVFHVDPSATGTINNTANISSTTSDPNGGNGSSSSPAVVSPATTDLSITKTANGNRFPPGAQVTYTITVTNNGPAVAANVVVNDTIPAGSTFVSATPSQGSCTPGPNVVCTIGTMLPSATATISLVINLPSTFGNVDNTATVTSTNADSAPANNSATASLAVASEIPSLSELGLAILAIALAMVAFVALRS